MLLLLLKRVTYFCHPRIKSSMITVWWKPSRVHKPSEHRVWTWQNPQLVSGGYKTVLFKIPLHFLSPHITFLSQWSLTFIVSSARDLCVRGPRLRQLQSWQQHVIGQQRSVTGGSASGLRVPPQGQRDTYQHPHAETWKHQVLGQGKKKKPRRWSTAFTFFLLRPSTYHLKKRSLLIKTYWCTFVTEFTKVNHGI